MTIQDSEGRRQAILEAEGLSRMAGSHPTQMVFPLLESYIDGSKSMEEVRHHFEEQFFLQHSETE